MAKVLNKFKDIDRLEEAIIYQTKAVQCFSNLEKYADSDYLASLVMSLSEFQDKVGQIDNALNSLRIVEKIYKNNYTEVHAKTCKVKRNISLLCLKSDLNEDALYELRQVEDLERTLYGENSTQLGKTYKVIGTIHLLNKNHSESREYLLKAQSIFEQKGLLKLLKEVKQKLKLLSPNRIAQMDGGLLTAQMIGGGMNDSDGDDIASPEVTGMGKRVKKKKSKKSAAGGAHRKINNFMRDR